jgi:ADP-ribose pyrophosphatase YjhB (NUDIX family)
MAQPADLAQRLAYCADRLRDVSAFGLRFSQSPYDRAHYQTVQDVAIELFALAAQELPEQFEPLRAPVLSRPTPFVGGDAAVIDEHGRLLLIRRADNQKWAMPGGALEVGETPAAGVEREAYEETGVRCQAVRLIGVFDSRLCGSVTRHHLYHLQFLCRPLDVAQLGQGSHRQEVLEVGWFAEAALPPDLDPGHASRIPEAFRVWRGDERAFFDESPGAGG